MAWQLDFSSEFATPSIEFVDPPSTYPVYGLSVCIPIDPDSMPSLGKLKRPWPNPIPDVFPTPGLNAVSQRFLELVEQFEPGIHQFFPLSVQEFDGASLRQELYIFNCAVGIDAIIFRGTQPNWDTDAIGVPLLRTGMGEKFELSRPAVGNRHLWCGKTVARNKLFVSDPFYATFVSRGMKAFSAGIAKNSTNLGPKTTSHPSASGKRVGTRPTEAAARRPRHLRSSGTLPPACPAHAPAAPK
jgi:hypothetical protein